MRHNTPVTQREYRLGEQQYLISQTDLEGNIVYANPDFVTVSGFDREELIGSPHNLIRHPDMPAHAFANFWQTIRSGDSWTGVIKNRRKNGDHYWVHATVTPIIEGEQTVGYASVRRCPDEQEKQLAEMVYAHLRAEQKPRAHLDRGVIRAHSFRARFGRLFRLTIGRRLALLIVIAALGMIGIALAGGYGLHSMYVTGQQIAERGVEQTGRLQVIDQRLGHYGGLISKAMGTANGAEVETLKQQLASDNAEVHTNWQAYLAHASQQPSDDRERMDEQLLELLDKDIPSIVTAMEKGSYFNAISQWRKETQPRIEQLHGLVNELVDQARNTALGLQQQAATRHDQAMLGMVGLASIVLLLLLTGGVLVGRGIVGPLQLALKLARQIAAGNLTAEVDTRRKDEIGQLMASMNIMRCSLISIVEDVQRGVGIVTPATADIASGNADLSRRTEEQAASLEQTASSMEELISTVAQSADSAGNASRLAREASDIAERGGKEIGNVVNTMDDISQASTRITDIVGMIDDIAFQTNILALNASVEAARAGEQGRGFAVVAGEVRALAGRSAEAAREIKSLITASSERVETGGTLVAQTRHTMDEIVSSIHRVSTLMAEVAQASVEQRSGIEQVTQTVTRMDEMTQQNAALVEQSAASAGSLSQQARELSAAVSIFRIKNVSAAPINTPINEMTSKQPESHTGEQTPAREMRQETNRSRAKPATVIAQRAALPARATVRPRREPVADSSVGDGEDEWETF